jgi:hypothetical protein
LLAKTLATESYREAVSYIWRKIQLSKLMKLLPIRFGYHRITSALGRCQTDTERRYDMKVTKAGKIWLDYHRIHSKKKHH